MPASSAKKICRSPCYLELPDINYDYSLVTEWEEPEEREDLDGVNAKLQAYRIQPSLMPSDSLWCILAEVVNQVRGGKKRATIQCEYSILDERRL